MPVTNYDDIGARPGRAGHIATSNSYHSRISRVVGGMAAPVRQVVVDTAADDTDYTVTVNGEAKTVDSGTGATKNSILLLLIAAINADSDLFSVLFAEEHPDNTDRLLITGRELGVATTCTAGANLTASEITAEDAGDNIPPGVVVCQDPSDPKGAILPEATTVAAVAQVTDATPATPSASDVAHFIVTRDSTGDGLPETYDVPVVPGATVALTCDAIVTAFAGPLITDLVVTDGTTKAIFTGPAGLQFNVTVNVEGGNGTTCAFAEDTAAVVASSTFTNAVLGPVILEQKLELPSGGGLVEFEPGDQIAIPERTAGFDVLLDVGETVAKGDPVYVRCTATGTEQRGACRNDSDSGDCLLWSGAEFITANFTGIDGQNVATIKRL